MASCTDSGPQVAKVNGTVKVDGQPLVLGTVIFASELGRQSTGRIVDGKIENVTTFEDGDGAIVGNSRVAIRPSVDESLMMKDPVKAAEEINKAGVPKKFFSLSTTELKFEIKYGQANNLEIDIASQ